jgi:hypothetical protein
LEEFVVVVEEEKEFVMVEIVVVGEVCCGSREKENDFCDFCGKK